MGWSRVESRLSNRIGEAFFNCEDDWTAVRTILLEEYPALSHEKATEIITDCCAELYPPSPRDLFLNVLQQKLKDAAPGFQFPNGG